MVRLDLLMYFTVSCSLVSGQSLYYGLKGLKVNLKPHITSRLPDEILWKHNDNKVIEFDGIQEQVYGQFKNRVTLDHVSAELSISDLRYEDSGEYEVETYTNKGFDRKKYKLEVIDKVAKPTISCKRDNGSFTTTHGNQATLSCSAEFRKPQHLQYEWISHGTVHPGQTLTITLSDDNVDYSCRVSNPLTSETTKFTTKDCNSDKSLSGALIAGLISAVVLVVIAVVAGIFCWKGKHKACFTKRNTDDVEKQLQPVTTEGSNKMGAHNEEGDPLLHRDANFHSKDEDLYTRKGSNKEKPQNEENISPPHRAPNVSSGQQLVTLPQSNGNMNPNDSDRNPTEDRESNPEQSEDNMSGKGLDKPSSPEGLNNVPGSNKDDADADQHKEPDSSASEKTTEPEPDTADELDFSEPL